MCGRFTLRTPAERVAEEFQLEETLPLEARYNIAPAQEVLAVRSFEEEREAVTLRWGLIPFWSKDATNASRLINARSETAAEKPSFRESFKRRRCIIPADGFYEWKKEGAAKRPFYFRMKDERLFGFAGLWDEWRDPQGERVETCAILTTGANELLRPVHERMPVILRPETYDLWLEDDSRRRELRKELLVPYPAEEMDCYAVSRAVNSPKNQGEELLLPVQ